MPSFSGSALSLLSDDQMSPQKGPTITTSGLRGSMAFETPPETAVDSPPPTSPLAPISPIRYSQALQHNLPGLARKSSTKSPVAAAELTTIQSRISQFMYSDQQVHSTKNSEQDSSINDMELSQDFSMPPNALEKSTLKSTLQNSKVSDGTTTILAASVVTSPLGRSRSTSDAQHRMLSYKDRNQGKDTQDINQFLTAQKQFRGNAISIPQSPAQTRPSLDQQQERPPPLPSVAKNIRARPSISHYQPTESGPLSPSQLLSGVNHDALLPKTKEERRKSAISFGGYFSSTGEAARRSRNLMDHPSTGLETDTKGEVIHLRRTSFFERASPPALTSLASLLQTSLPSLSQSMAGPASPTLSRSPSNVVMISQEHRPGHSRRPSGMNGIVNAEGSGASRHLAAISASNTAGGSAAATGESREAKKKVTPLKITPLLLSGLPSMPSPMFPPMSASIPRPLTAVLPHPAAPILDRYFFSADQVHEWNIPSYGRVKFTDHAPLVFQAIRERFNYTLADMDEALSQPMAVMKTPGKSDAIFFASHNHGRFLLKTLRGAEPENLKGFLGDYLAHIQKHPNTLLPRYLGMYTFERISGAKILNGGPGQPNVLDGVGGGGGGGVSGGDREYGLGSKLSFSKGDVSAAQRLHLNGTLLSGKDDGLPSKMVVVVLANVFDTPEVIHERYDFKGSNVGRRTLPVDRPMREKSMGQQDMTRVESGMGFTEPEPSLVDIVRRRSRRGDPALRESRHSTAQYELAGEHSQGTGRHASGEPVPPVTDDISHLTLKETDFQSRVFTGETQLIHLGQTRRAEVLAQLEDDTALLRKHGFMDYSMLVGIRIVPKAGQKEEEIYSHSSAPSSSGPSRRGSISSRGSDADNSNLESDDDISPVISMAADNATQPKGEFVENLDRFWKLMDISKVLTDDQIAFFRDLGERAQETLREIYAFGQTSEDPMEDKGQPAGVELRPVQSTREMTGSSNMERKTTMDADDITETFDPNDFQTVRYKHRISVARGHSIRKQARQGMVDGTEGKESNKEHEQQQKHHSKVSVPDRPQDSLLEHPFEQQKNHNQPLLAQEHQPTWSQGISSEGLPDGYEVVYYFGLIDVLQKYNLVKWLERNIKGANVRLLGGAGGTSTTSATSQNPS
ncbi:Phosphatidylinositol 5-phosphate 4-kinase type-2 alpha, partial [Gamsiella multidivaricata]